MTLLSDWGIVPIMIRLVPEVNRTFSPGAFGVIKLGVAPGLDERQRLWRYLATDFIRNFYGAAKPISIVAFGFCVFTITALAGCTSTSLYLISSRGFKENS